MERQDQTPSVMHNVRDTVPPLPSPGATSDSLIPVLQVSKKAIFWRRARWPIALVVLAVVLAATGLITREMLIRGDIEEALAEAGKLEAGGTIDDLHTAKKNLVELAERHPNRGNVQAALAWLNVLEFTLFDGSEALGVKARAAVALAQGENTPQAVAAAAGIELIAGKLQEALDRASQGLSDFPGEPRLELIRGRSLHRMGRSGPALEWLSPAMVASPEYAPLPVAGIGIAIEAGARDALKSSRDRLLAASTEQHPAVILASTALALPALGEDTGTIDDPVQLVDLLTTTKVALVSAPPRLALLGRFLVGRIELISGRLDQASRALAEVASASPSATVFGWFTEATHQLKGPAAALELLDSRPEIDLPQVLFKKARALVELHRVNGAAPVLDKLRTATELSDAIGRLRFARLVRSGKTDEALDALPESLPADRRGLAVELYFQLKQAGDREGIEKLRESLTEELKSCSEAIAGWQSRSTRRALRNLSASSKDPCVSALAARLLFGRASPSKLARSVERAAPAAGTDLCLEIDRARITWLGEGMEAALAILDGIRKLAPEGAPIRRELAAAYLTLERPEEALEVLGDLDDADALALRYQAARSAEGVDTKSLVAEAGKRHDASPESGTLYVALRAQYGAGKYRQLARKRSVVMPHAGRWTGEIADMLAKSINLTDDRTEADRLLVKVARGVGVHAGMDEAWEVKLSQIRLNMRRGGKFARKAAAWIGELRGKGLKDAPLAFGLAMSRIRGRKEKEGRALLRQAIAIDPSFKPAYVQLEKMGSLDDEARERVEAIWPDWKP